MKTKFYLNGKKVSRKAAQEQAGAERLARMLKEAREEFQADLLTRNDFFIGSGMLTIAFE